MKEKNRIILREISMLFLALILSGYTHAQTVKTVGGVGGDYTELMYAIADINSGILTGDIVLKVSTGASMLIGMSIDPTGGAGGANYNSIRIVPASASLVSFTEYNYFFLQFNGASNVTIDGSFNGTGQYFSFRNTDQYSPTIKILNNCNNITIKNCIIEGNNSRTSVTPGIIEITDFNNDNITIDSCIIRSYTAFPYAAYGIAIYETYGRSDYITIKNCQIYDVTNNAIDFMVSSNLVGRNITITGNQIYSTISNSNIQYAIKLPGGYNHNISNNYIGGNGPLCSGTWSKTGGSFTGIYCTPLTGGSFYKINGNYIQNFSLNNSSNISFTAINATANNTASMQCNSNTISGITNSGNSVMNYNAIKISSMGGMTNIEAKNNNIYSLTNSSTDANSSFNGINISGGGTGSLTINNNTIHDLSSNLASPSLAAINIATGCGNSTINNNTIYNLSSTYPSGFVFNMYGIFNDGLNTGLITMAGNTIYNFTRTSTGAGALCGIRLTPASGPADIYNNMISLGANVLNDNSILLLYLSAQGSQNVYNNSLYIGGSSPGIFGTEIVIGENGTGSLTCANNLITNYRSGGSHHWGLITNDATTLSSDYNLFYPSLMGSYDNGNTILDLTSWKNGTGQDANSQIFVPAYSNTAIADLHISYNDPAFMGGTFLPVVTTDYDGTARANPPCIGADEFAPSSPSTQASSINFSNVTDQSVTLSWTKGNGYNRALFVLQGNSGTAAPVNNATYTANAAFGSGTQIGSSGWYCVYKGSGTTTTVTGLAANTAYRFMLCEFSGTAGYEKYNTSTNGSNPVNQSTCVTIPTSQATNIIISNVTTSQFEVNWTNGNGTARSAFVAIGSTGSAAPLSLTDYTANSNPGSGSQIGSSGWYCVYNGTGTTVTVTGLSAATTYRVMVCEYNGTSANAAYLVNTAVNNPVNQKTLYTTPITQATNVTGSVYSTQVNLNWTNGSGSARAVFAKQTNTGSPVPVNMTEYGSGTGFGTGTQIGSTGWYCVALHNGSSAVVTGLAPNTTYSFMVVELNGGINERQYLTSTATNNPVTFTTSSQPTVQASNLALTNVLLNTATLNWTRGDGENCVVFAKQGTGTPPTLPSGATYTANSSFGSGTQFGATGWYCVYNGTGNFVNLSSLATNTQYSFKVYEYNGASTSESYLNTTNTNNPLTSNTNNIVSLTATSATTTGQYTTLKAAIDAVNSGTHKGDIVIQINANTTETATASLNASGTGSSSYSSLRIQPGSANEYLVSGAITGSLINLNGADNVTIDGRYNSAGMYLRFRNTTNTQSTLQLSADAVNNNFKYIYLEGSNTNVSAPAGVVYFAAGTASGNDNNTFDNCHIRNCSAVCGTPAYLVWMTANAGVSHDYNTFTNNQFYEFTSSAIYTGVNSGSGYNISSNHFYNISSTTNSLTIINVTGGHSHTINNNYIGGNGPSCSGTFSKANGGVSCITYSAATGGVPTQIQGNTIQNFAWTTTNGMFFIGVDIAGSNASVDIGTTAANNIGNVANIAGCVANAYYKAICIRATSGMLNISNNVISNMITYTASTPQGPSAGIFCGTNGTTLNISNNTIHDITSNENASLNGIYLVNTTPNQSISGNKIYNLYTINTTANVSVYGIYTQFTNTGTNNINNNTIYNLQEATSSASGQITGIYSYQGVCNVFNNMITLGTSESGNYYIVGIQDWSMTSMNVYSNSVKIEGTVTAGALFSAPFHAVCFGGAIAKSNIFYNTRSGGTGKHPAVYCSNAGNITADKNVYYSANPANLATSNNGTNWYNFADWKTATAQDPNSLNIPLTFTNSAIADLHVIYNSKICQTGEVVSFVTNDFDEETRNDPPCIGADEFDPQTPSTQTTNILFSNVTDVSFKLKWTAGDGSKRVVFVKATNTGSPIPVNNITYLASSNFGNGSQIGVSGWYCVYNGNADSVVVTGLNYSTTYRAMVCEYDGGPGNEKYFTDWWANNPKNQNTAIGQTITFNAISPKTYGDADFDPGASSSSGLTVVYTSSDPLVATIVSNKLHFVGTGSCTIYANQPGDITYPAAQQKSQLLTVNQAELMALADNKSKTYGDANPSLTISYSGFVNGDDASDITEPSASTTALTGSPAGGYLISLIGGSAANYAITLVNATLTVNKAPLTVTAGDKSKIYGNANPSLTFSYSGFVNGDNASSITEPTISTTAVTASSAGTYPISLTGG